MNRFPILQRLLTIWIVLFLSAILPGNICSGQETGLPFLRNFTTQDYNAHPQNFSLVKGDDGLMYFANFAGVLQYDGHFWRLIPTTKTSRVSCLSKDKSGRILCGAFGEAGYLKSGSFGKFSFDDYKNYSLIDKAGNKEVIASFCLEDGNYFATSEKVINISNGKFWTSPEKIVSAFFVDNQLYLQLKNAGIGIFHNYHFSPIPGGNFFSGVLDVRSIVPTGNTGLFVGTSTQGLFKLEDGNAFGFKNEAEDLLMSGIITCGIAIPGFGYAFGTARNGIVIINAKGKLLQVINKKSGLNDDYIRMLYYDADGTLWVAMNNGIARMDIPSTLTYFDEKAGLDGGINAICRNEEGLYVATYQGLFLYKQNQRAFERIQGIKTACWSLLRDGNELLAASSEGLYKVSGMKSFKLFDGFCLSLAGKQGKFFIGTANGLYSGTSASKAIVKEGTLSEEIKNLTFDSHGYLWGVSGSEQILRFNPDAHTYIAYDSTKGIKESRGAAIAFWNGGLTVLTRVGVLKYNSSKDLFELNTLTDSTDLFGDWYSIIIGVSDGNSWVTSGDQKNLRKLIQSKDKYISDQSAFLPFAEKVISCILPDQDGVTWFGGPDGLYRYDPLVRKDDKKTFVTMIRKVSLSNDSVLFFGNVEAGTKAVPPKRNISYQYNTIRFDFATPFQASYGKTYYQFKLEGFDDTWSDWSEINTKEYTNLSAGDYIFKVKARNSYGKVSEISSWQFSVSTPWYMRWWAIVFYIMLGIVLFVFLVRMRNRQLLNEKRILEQRIADRTLEVTKQKEEIEKQSDELSNKNAELEKINNLVKSINSEINFASLLQSLLEKMRMIRAVERSSTLIFDEDEHVFRFKAALGWDFDRLKDIKISDSQAEQLFLAGSEEVYEDIFLKTTTDGYNETMQFIEGSAVPKTILIIVIKVNERIVAYLVLENLSRYKAFENKDLNFILHSKEHIISAFIKTKILADLQGTLDNLKDAQDQLVQSEKLASLGQLTAGIAHEIQNPLNFVNNFSQLSVGLAQELRGYLEEIKETMDSAKFADFDEVIGLIEGNIQKIGEHGKRVSSIVKGMLQHSRGRSGEFEIVDINTMVEEYVNLAYHGARAKDSSFNTKLNTTLDPTAGKMSVVPQDISRVILNILNNAFYAVSERSKMGHGQYSPEVVIRTKRISNKVEITIRDNGTGIPKHVLEKIFNPFFTTKPTGQGTGLGLSLSFDIITQIHKGKLEVNTQEGEFTEFVITLPDKVS
jgi:signal transduction histidine kinase